MHSGIGAAIGVWVAAIASAVVVIHQVEHPMRGTPADRVSERIGVANTMPETETVAPSPEAPAPVRATAAEPGDTVEPLVMEADDENAIVLPMDTIVGRVPAYPGERPDDLVVGPGTVTHPATVPPARVPEPMPPR